jgi:hypothetical protein
MLNDFDVGTDEAANPIRMGKQRRKMALLVTLIGLATFVTPLVWTDSEILGRTRWSPLGVISALFAGTLPIGHPMSRELALSLSIDFLMGVGVIYVLLGLVAAAILFLPSARFIGTAAAAGAAVVFGNARFRYPDLQDAIYGEPSSFVSGHEVHAGTNCVILLSVFGLLIWITATKELE